MPPGVVVRVGAQSGYAVDDVAIETAADGLVLCQVKTGLALGKPAASPLAAALDQVVAQYLAGVRGRPVTPGCDMLVIVTDADAPRTVRSHLATAISRTATQPPGTPFGDKLTGPEEKAQAIALTHIRQSWTARRGAPSNEDLHRLLSVLAVVAVDSVDGGRDRAAAQATVRGFVPPGDEQRAWDALVAVGREASISREWRSRPDLVTAVARHGVIVGPGPSAARDIALLRAATQSNLAALRASTTLPVGDGMHLPRHADNELAAAGPADGGVLVVGEAGSGKTGVLVTLAAARSERGQDVVVLRATDLTAGAVSGNTRLSLPIEQVLLSWTGGLPATLVIDALDAARGSSARARLAELVGALAESRWQVVASVRTFDLIYGPGLRAAFTGEPVSVDPTRRDSRLDGIRHIRVGDLTEAELNPLTTSATPVADFYAAASAELQALLRNPFNLRLASELLAPGVAISRPARQRLTSAKTQLDLLAAYWEHRIDQDTDAFARTDLLTRIAEKMLQSRQLRVLAAAPTVEATHSGALTGLLSDNVLAKEDRSGTAARRVLIFSHHILFDYTSMRCVLRNPLDELQLLQRLDADPALPLVAQPSLDMLFDDLWQAAVDRHPYWQLALALAVSPHLLASLPAAARLAAAGPSTEDLLPLAAACTGHDPDRRDAGYSFLSQITGAIRSQVTPEAAVTAATAALARLAADLSDTAKKETPTWQCLGAIIDLLNALQLRRRNQSGVPG
jgi:RecA/RadA recombinase